MTEQSKSQMSTILAKDVPEHVLRAASLSAARYTVGFVRLDATAGKPDATLLGTGILASAGDTKAIITNHHVIAGLPRNGRLGLILEDSVTATSVDVNGLHYLPIAKGTKDSEGPDLGIIKLAPRIATSIGTSKLFYPLDKYRDRTLKTPPQTEDGIWLANGFVDERTTERRNVDGYALVKCFFNFSAIGGPENDVVRDGYDYVDLPVSYVCSPPPPTSFGGMSGGGLWHFDLLQKDNILKVGDPMLCGVVFYQHPIVRQASAIRCHGHRSVCDVVYKAIEEL